MELDPHTSLNPGFILNNRCLLDFIRQQGRNPYSTCRSFWANVFAWRKPRRKAYRRICIGRGGFIIPSFSLCWCQTCTKPRRFCHTPSSAHSQHHPCVKKYTWARISSCDFRFSRAIFPRRATSFGSFAFHCRRPPVMAAFVPIHRSIRHSDGTLKVS